MLDNVLRWYVIHTKPRQEDRADSNLRAWNIEIFNPKRRESYCNSHTGKLAYQVKPLFPRYIFAQFPDDMLQKIRFTRGVYRIVSAGDSPTPVDEEIIRLIRSQTSEQGFVRMGEKFCTGDKVTIHDGVLKNLNAIFIEEMNDRERVMLLLMAVNYQAHIVVQKGLIKKAI
jgi:transcriptional antiterminator RfaH